MVLDTAFLNTQGKEKCPPLNLGLVAIEKGAFGLPSTKIANFLKLYLTGSLAYWIECSSMIRETWVQSQVTSYLIHTHEMVLDSPLLNSLL